MGARNRAIQKGISRARRAGMAAGGGAAGAVSQAARAGRTASGQGVFPGMMGARAPLSATGPGVQGELPFGRRGRTRAQRNMIRRKRVNANPTLKAAQRERRRVAATPAARGIATAAPGRSPMALGTKGKIAAGLVVGAGALGFATRRRSGLDPVEGRPTGQFVY